MKFFNIILLLLLSLSSVFAEEKQVITMEKANKAQLSAAVGHYARARSLIIAAIREFDSGLKTANPQSLIDVAEWRNDLISRAEDLDKVLAPQPRMSKDGVQYPSDTRLLEEAK